MPTKIEWADETWNPLVGCSKTSPGCDNCYAISVAHRGLAPQHRGLTVHTDHGVDWTGEVKFVPEVLDKPLHWKRPRRIFVNSLSDLFHPAVDDETIFSVLAVMTLAPQHTYQVLTKRPQRMAALMSDPGTPGRVAQAADRIQVRSEIDQMGDERFAPVPGYPGYVVTDRGNVLLEGGSDTCIWCGSPIPEDRIARARFCQQKCNSKAHYEKSQGRWQPPVVFREMRPDVGEQGHLRVALMGTDGAQHRELVHRLVLHAFYRPPEPGEQACHLDGDPSNNALPNLRWGTQEDNWIDRNRHGNSRSRSKLSIGEVKEIRSLHDAGTTVPYLAERFKISDTQVRNIVRGVQWASRIDWPLPCLWLGTSIESDRYAWRADHLRATPAAVRFISAEPLLGPLPSLDLTGIDWLIVGGESGAKARPMHPDWVRDLRDRCVATRGYCDDGLGDDCCPPGGHGGTAFLFKQHGSFRTFLTADEPDRKPTMWVRRYDGVTVANEDLIGDDMEWTAAYRMPKHEAGRTLDGLTWDEFPADRVSRSQPSTQVVGTVETQDRETPQ